MPFNVYDRNKKFLGFIQCAYPQYTNVFMAANTDVKLNDNDFNINKVKSELASFLGCKSMLGKINEPRLNKSIDNIITKELGKYKNNSREELLKLVYLRILRDEDNFHYKKIENSQIRSYFLVDISKAVIENDSVIIDEEIEFINTDKIGNDIPMVAMITEYPRIQIDSMLSGQGLLLGANLEDLVGRTHFHRTKLKIKSGNFISNLDLPVELYLKKGDTIQIYIDNRVIKRIFCDGIIYEF